MKIAIDGMLLKSPFTGVETAILNLAKALAVQGRHDYRLFVPGTCPEEYPATEHMRTCRTRLPTHFRPVRIFWQQVVLPGILRRQKFDLLHAPGYIAPVRAGVPVVLSVYDLMAIRFPEWCRPLNRLNYRLFLPGSIRRAAAVIVPSVSVARDVAQRFPGTEERIAVIPLGVGEAFRPVEDRSGSSEVRKKYGLHGRVILFVGNPDPRKNLPALVRAFHALRSGSAGDSTLVLAGHAGWGRPALKREVQRLGLSGDVAFLGYVSDQELVTIYSLADVFVFPSFYEGFGLPPLEAMACGVPVVCSNAEAVLEVVGDAALTFDPGDVGAMAEAIGRALTDPGLRARLIEKGLRRVKGFCWKKAAEAAENVYAGVAGKAVSRGTSG